MKCQYCEKALPDESEFCLFCGKKLITTLPPQAIESEINSENLGSVNDLSKQTLKSNSLHASKSKERFCKRCGNVIDEISHKCISCGKRSFSFNLKNFIISFFAIIIVASISVLILLWIEFQKNEELYLQELSDRKSEIHELENDNEIKDVKIESLDEEIKGYKEQIINYKKDTELLNQILTFVRSSDAGIASAKFKVSDKIFVVDKYNTQTSFTLTCSFGGYTTIYTETKGNAASVDFSQNSWVGETTKLFIKPKKVGTTIVTFSNDKNDQSFRILIIVTD